MKKYWPYLLAIIFLAIFIRFPTFFGNYVNIDENEYAIAAQKILAGGFPYKDVLIYHPPFIYYIYALGFWLTGGVHIWSAQIIAILFVVGTMVTLYFLTSAVTGCKKSGLISAGTYGIFSVTFLPMDMLAANCEILMMLPLTLSVLFLFHAEAKGSHCEPEGRSNPVTPTGLPRHFVPRNDAMPYLLYLLAGIFASIGFLTKYQGGIVIAAEVFYVLIVTAILRYVIASPKGEAIQLASRDCFTSFAMTTFLKKNLLPSFILVIGFCIPSALFAIYLMQKGAIREATEALLYIFLYAKSPAQSDPLYMMIKFSARTILFILPGIVMWAGAAMIIVKYLKGFPRVMSGDCRALRARNDGKLCHCEERNDEAIPRPHSFIYFGIIWFFASIIPVIVGGRMYFHYYFTLLPPAAFLFGVRWAENADKVKKKAKVIAVVWLVVNIIGWTSFAAYYQLNQPKKKDVWKDAAAYLKANSKKGDSLFVWGYAPQIYITSGLEPLTRFTTSDYLTGRSPMTAGLEYDPASINPPSSFEKVVNDFKDTPSVVHFDTSANIFPNAWEYLKADFLRELPTYFVDTSPSNYRRYGRYPLEKYPFLKKILGAHYELIGSFNGFDIYKIR